MIKVAAGVIIDKGKVLIAQRAAADKLALKWEFPGGKMEKSETPEFCLVREIKEELGIDIKVIQYCTTSVFHYETGTVELIAYFAEMTGGAIKPYVHNDVKWVDINELADFDFASADLPIREIVMKSGNLVFNVNP